MAPRLTVVTIRINQPITRAFFLPYLNVNQLNNGVERKPASSIAMIAKEIMVAEMFYSPYLSLANVGKNDIMLKYMHPTVISPMRRLMTIKFFCVGVNSPSYAYEPPS